MSNSNQLSLKISGMSCVGCAARLEKALNQIPKVSAQVNFATETAIINSPNQINTNQVLSSIDNAGFQAVITDSNDREPNKNGLININYSNEFYQFLGAAIFSAPLILPMIASFMGLVPLINNLGMDLVVDLHLSPPIQFGLASIVQFIFGKKFYISGWRSFRAGSSNMDTLIALGTSSAYLLSTIIWILSIDFVGLYFEASAGIITFVLLGKLLEARAKKSSQSALEALKKLKPMTAHKLIDQIQENQSTIEVPADQLEIGNRILVRSGESIPADGIIINGNANIDESMLTGESLPVKKNPKDLVYTATINTDGLLIVEVHKTPESSLLASIIQLVSQAQESKAKIQKLVDKIAEIFVPAVMVISIITFIGWLIAGRYGWTSFSNISLTIPNIVLMSIINATTVLVIACPCAIGLATPMAIVVAIEKAAQNGILVRDFGVFERLIKINRVGFDKTGTLTLGKPKLIEIKAFADLNQNKILQIVSSLEIGTNHPLANVVINEANNKRIASIIPTRVKNNPGLGIEGIIDGKKYFCGSAKFISTQGIDLSKSKNLDTNNGLLYLADHQRLIGILFFEDQLRPTSIQTIKEWHQRGIKTAILSGDRRQVVESIITSEHNINHQSKPELFYELLPKEKLNKIRNWQKKGDKVIMIGDGINDAPALAIADVGIAIGEGSEAAIKTADITLLKDDLLQSLRIFDLAFASFATIKRNLFFAFIFNSLAIPIAALGFINPLAAGILMTLSSLTVVGSSLILKLWRAKI